MPPVLHFIVRMFLCFVRKWVSAYAQVYVPQMDRRETDQMVLVLLHTVFQRIQDVTITIVRSIVILRTVLTQKKKMLPTTVFPRK